MKENFIVGASSGKDEDGTDGAYRIPRTVLDKSTPGGTREKNKARRWHKGRAPNYRRARNFYLRTCALPDIKFATNYFAPFRDLFRAREKYYYPATRRPKAAR